MTTTMNAGDNGKVRKSLASQIDRLDATLDGLADAIPEVVADTIRSVAAQAVRDAVQTAITEVLTSPELLSKLRAVSAPVACVAPPLPQKPSVWQRLKTVVQAARSCLANLRRACGSRVRRMGAGAVNLWRKAVSGLALLWGQRWLVTEYKYPLLTALGVGTSVAAGAWFAGPRLSAVISGVGGFAASLGVQGWLWFRKMMAYNQQMA
jgi:hypothetical protein